MSPLSGRCARCVHRQSQMVAALVTGMPTLSRIAAMSTTPEVMTRESWGVVRHNRTSSTARWFSRLVSV